MVVAVVVDVADSAAAAATAEDDSDEIDDNGINNNKLTIDIHIDKNHHIIDKQSYIKRVLYTIWTNRQSVTRNQGSGV